MIKILYKENVGNFKDIIDYTYISDVKVNDFTNATKVKDINRWSIYDSTIGNRTIKGPDKPGSYAILDIYENNKKVFLTWGESVEECYVEMNKFEGVKPLCVVNCLNFGHPEDSMGNFSYTVKTISNSCSEFDIPVVGGNVSLYNSTDGKSIRPTPVILMLGIS